MKRTLACGALRLELTTDDASAADWLSEFLAPWFVAAAGADVAVTLSTSAAEHAALAGGRPADAVARPCFRLDREIVSLPSWRDGEAIRVADGDRACFLRMRRSRIDLVADPSSRRWRFTLQWIFHELAATALRSSAIDLHAAAVEGDGRALVLIGPKRAGKTTASLHCLRGGRARWIANDRAFTIASADGLHVRGMPNVVKIQPPTLADFPELALGLRAIERPYLHSVAEVCALDDQPRLEPGEFALSPAQIARQLAIEARAEAPIGALAFPEVREDVEGVVVVPLDRAEAAERIAANLYGKTTEGQGATLFDELFGAAGAARPDAIDALAASVPSHRVLLGRGAYAAPDFADRFLGELLP